MIFSIFHIVKTYSLIFIMAITYADELFSLDNYTWKNRVILLFGNEGTESKIDRQLNILLEDEEGLQDRDLKIFRIDDQQVLEMPKWRNHD